MRVWLHRTLALAWVAFGVLSVLMGWQESVALVWFASVYANVYSSWSAAEAADDHALMGRLDDIERKLDAIRID